MKAASLARAPWRTMTGSSPRRLALYRSAISLASCRAPLTFTVVTGPANGALSGIAPNLTYTPGTNFNGSDGLTFRASDGSADSSVATVSLTITPVNDPPVLALIGDQSVSEEENLSFSLSAADVDGDPLVFSALGLPTNAGFDPSVGDFTYTPLYDVSTAAANTVFMVIFEVTDPAGRFARQVVRITVLDVNGGTEEGQDVTTAPKDPEIGDAPVDLSFSEVEESGVASLDVTEMGSPPPSGFKISGSPPTYFDITTEAVFNGPIEVCIDFSFLGLDPTTPQGRRRIERLKLLHLAAFGALLSDGVTACADEAGCWEDVTNPDDPPNHPNPNTDTMTLCGTAFSLSPFALTDDVVITAPLDPVQVGTEVAVSTGTGALGDLRSFWTWGDGTVSEGFGDAEDPDLLLGTHVYEVPGVYRVSLSLQNLLGEEAGSALFEFLVAFDPEGGFVTGGGWIDSPEGAYVPDPALVGKASFGFVSKYKKGTTIPTGETEFQFKVADLNFHSDVYDWLVVAGARAQFKGTGTINGLGHYGFMLTAIDGEVNGGGGVDRFRVKIWDKDSADEIVYDNQMEAAEDAEPATEIGGGSIVIHDGKGPK